MNSIELHRKILGRDILVSMVTTEAGIQIIVAGGDKAHIGAVTIVDPDGKDTTIGFDGHKEEVITKEWARKIYALTGQSTVISAGIHFDNASKEMIVDIVEETGRLLEEICCLISEMS